MKKLLILTMLFILWVSCAKKDEDSEPPTVSITNPANGAVVKDTVIITATATDNNEVVKVDFYIDGNRTSTDTLSPYTYAWSTTALPESSSHDIQAKAYDDSDNEGVSATVTVKVVNATVTPHRIFIWLYDPLDVFYDGKFGDTVNCSKGIEDALTANGYTFEKGNVLPASLDPYDVVFVTLGWFRC